MNGTVALVSGASSGIGYATAIRLAGAGATVVVTGRRLDRLQDLAASIVAEGGTALAVRTDVGVREEAEAAVAQAVERFGRLDIVVNSAGIGALGPFESTDPETWEEMIAVNVNGVMATTKAALSHLVAAAAGPRGVADIVTISSVAGRVPRRGYTGYSLTKAGVNAFTEALRGELADKQVRAGVVAPGATKSEFASKVSGTALADMKTIISGFTWLDSEDVADAVHYMVTRPAHVAVNDLTIRPSGQTA